MTNNEAIEIVTHFDKHIIPCDEYGYRIDSDLMDAHSIAVKALRNGWIPVSERLPVDWCPVLVMVRDVGRPLLGSYRENVWFHEQWNTTFIKGAVTHWMPLPEPPKE